MNEKEVKIVIAGLLHDIGKVILVLEYKQYKPK